MNIYIIATEDKQGVKSILAKFFHTYEDAAHHVDNYLKKYHQFPRLQQEFADILEYNIIEVYVDKNKQDDEVSVIVCEDRQTGSLEKIYKCAFFDPKNAASVCKRLQEYEQHFSVEHYNISSSF